MTATDVSAVTPAEDANDLLIIAKRNLLVNNIPEAVSNLAKACELQSKQFGETAKEFAEAYYDVDYVKNVKGTNCWRRRIRKVANDNNGYNFAVSNKNNYQRECDMTFNVAAIKFCRLLTRRWSGPTSNASSRSSASSARLCRVRGGVISQ